MSSDTHEASRPALLERAFEIARSGECGTLRALQERLAAEDYLDTRAQFEGASTLRRQLLATMHAARRGQARGRFLPPQTGRKR